MSKWVVGIMILVVIAMFWKGVEVLGPSTSTPFQNIAITTSIITPIIHLLINNSHILQIPNKQSKLSTTRGYQDWPNFCLLCVCS